jgi:tRNA(His) 5'-end guanylyltransferase
MKDALGDRMKHNYEDRTRYYLPRRAYTIIRVDGKAFHSLTRKCERPFDLQLTFAMNATTIRMCQEIMGAKCAYVQSDEISILLTDFDKDTTDAWFDGNIQKIASVSASMATAFFNDEVKKFDGLDERITKLAMFDARVFSIADKVEVENYFIWRQKDAMRNSLQMIAQSLFSHKELQGKNQKVLYEMVTEAGYDCSNLNQGLKMGRMITKGEYGFQTDNIPVFTEDNGYISELVPRMRPEDY